MSSECKSKCGRRSTGRYGLPHAWRGLLLATWMVAGPAAADDRSVAGRWLTVDDRTGAPRGVVRLEESGGELTGYIERGLRREGEPPDPPTCERCPGELRGRPMQGLRFLWGFRRTGAEWSGGHILDPDEGSIYSCAITLSEDGTTLRVRGYLGLEIFGRTQVWRRYSP